MRGGCCVIGGSARRIADRVPPAPHPEYRVTDRYIELAEPTVSHRRAGLVVYNGSARLIGPEPERGMHVLLAARCYRIHEEEVSPQTAVELGRRRRHMAELPEAAGRGADRGGCVTGAGAGG